MESISLDNALLEAAGRGSQATMQSLLAQGANVNARSNTGQTPLLRVIRKRRPALVRWLLEQGAEVNAADRHNLTALHLAAQGEDAEICELLLNAGADPDAGDRYQRPPLWYALQRRSRPVTHLLLDRGADPNAMAADWPLLFWAMRRGPDLEILDWDMEIIRDFLDHGADPNIVWSTDWTPLFAAAFQGDLALVHLLLQYGARPQVLIGGALSPKPLLGAAMRRQPTILQVLLEHGADPNLADPIDGLTALLYTVVNNDADSVRLLLAAGADATLPCARTGETPLDVAISEGRPEIERLLREAIEDRKD